MVIASISGRIAEVEVGSLVVEVGGIGLQVNVPTPLSDDSKPGNVISLHTYLVVRETELSLYGFASKEEREYFTLLIGVSGIGPRIGLAMVSTLSPNAIRGAVFNDQPEVLSSVAGVGKKTAQKIILHLQDRIPAGDEMEPFTKMDETDSEVLAALTALGYSVVEAQAALQSISKEAADSIEERLKQALAYFSPLV